MRKFVAAAVILGALTVTGAMPAQAVGTRHTFCLQGDEYPFDTYEQCLASASGRNLQCMANPFYDGPSDDPYAYQNRGRPFPPTYVPVPPNAYRRY